MSLGIIFLVISLLLAGGAFYYRLQLQSDLKEKNDQLSAETKKFSQEDLAEIYSLNNRLEMAKTLLDNHLASTKLLAAVEQTTSEQVQYVSFGFTQSGEGDSSPALNLTGQTSRFNNLLVQREAFNKSEVLKDTQLTSVSFQNPSNSSLQLEDGSPDLSRSVTFGLDAAIDPASIRYDGGRATVNNNQSPSSSPNPIGPNGEPENSTEPNSPPAENTQPPENVPSPENPPPPVNIPPDNNSG